MTSSLLQRIRQWEACLVDCLSECNKISSVLCLTADQAVGGVFGGLFV